jgi:hypothetical protein
VLGLAGIELAIQKQIIINIYEALSRVKSFSGSLTATCILEGVYLAIFILYFVYLP